MTAPRTINVSLTIADLELIAHAIQTYEQNYSDRKFEHHQLAKHIEETIEDLQLEEYLEDVKVVYGEIIDND